MIIAELAYTIRIPYHAMVNSAGVFKETKGMAIEEAVINLVISVIVVYKYGIVGVAVGTALSCIYRTIRYYMFFHKNILCLEWRKIMLRLFAMVSSLSLSLVIFTRINLECSSYIRWSLCGMLYLLISCVITMSIFILLFKKDFKELIYYGKNVFHNRKS
jgi:O-antigen/teichoic acid export membrane protein